MKFSVEIFAIGVKRVLFVLGFFGVFLFACLPLTDVLELL